MTMLVTPASGVRNNRVEMHDSNLDLLSKIISHVTQKTGGSVKIVSENDDIRINVRNPEGYATGRYSASVGSYQELHGLAQEIGAFGATGVDKHSLREHVSNTVFGSNSIVIDNHAGKPRATAKVWRQLALVDEPLSLTN